MRNFFSGFSHTSTIIFTSTGLSVVKVIAHTQTQFLNSDLRFGLLSSAVVLCPGRAVPVSAENVQRFVQTERRRG